MKLPGWRKVADNSEIQRWVNNDSSIVVRVDKTAPKKYYLTINNKHCFETIFDKLFSKKEAALKKAYSWMKNHPGDKITGKDFEIKYPELKLESRLVSETDLSGSRKGQTKFSIPGKQPKRSRTERVASVEVRNKRKKKTKQGGLEQIGLRKAGQGGLEHF